MFILSFCGGTSALLVFLLAFDLSRESNLFDLDTGTNAEIKRKKVFWEAILASNPIFRFCFLISYILFAVGLCVNIFLKYKINYFHIFELSYHHKVTDHQLWSAAIILTSIWLLALYWHV